MILSSGYQAKLFFSTIAVGVLIAFAYDVLRIFRKIIPHPNLLIQVEDAIYWVLVVLTMFTFMLHENFGEIRFFSIIGAFLGMLIYFLTVSKVVIKLSSAVIDVAKRILILFFTIVFTPFRLVLMLFRKPVKKTSHFFCKKSKKLLQSGKRYVRINNKKMKQAFYIIMRKR